MTERGGDMIESTRVRNAMAVPTMWSNPPGRLREQLLAKATDDRRSPSSPHLRSVGESLSTPEPNAILQLEVEGEDFGEVVRRHQTSRSGIWPAAAAASVAALLGAGILLFSNSPTARDPVALSPTDAAPAAVGSVEFRQTSSGVAVTLAVSGLAPAEPGTYYAAWLMGDTSPIPLGSFSLARGGETSTNTATIELWSALLSERTTRFMVTVQAIDGPPTPSDRVVLTGAVSSDA